MDYKKLLEISKRAKLLFGVEMLMEWDTETYLPKEGLTNRTEQKELIASMIHAEKTSTQFKKGLSSLIDLESGKILDTSLDDDQIANLIGWRRDYIQDSSLPASFVKEFAKVTGETTTIWANARKVQRASAPEELGSDPAVTCL